mgnify:FL=1
MDTPAVPLLTLFTQIRCEVGPVQSLGPAPLGERRFVELLGGSAHGPGLSGEIVPGGVDWQIARDDHALEIDAHYVIRTAGGALVEVRSQGLRHGSPEVLARLGRGEPVGRHEYFFRTVMRFTTGHPGWEHLNRVMALAIGHREPRQVVLDVYQVH